MGSKVGKGFLILRRCPFLQPGLDAPQVSEIQRGHQPRPHAAIFQIPAQVISLPQREGLADQLG